MQPAPDSGGRFTALVLAGDRGPIDPVCRATGVAHKCLTKIAGRTMLQRVVEALAASPRVGPIAVVLTDPALLSDLEALKPLVREKRLLGLPAAASPSRSVLAALDALEDPYPLLVTTADHALLSREMIDHICAESAASGADVSVGVTASEILLRSYPQSRRTYLRFREERYSGSNLFAFLKLAGRKAAETWRRAEQHRKRPWQIAGVFGPVLLLSYLLRLLSLDGAMARISRRLRITAIAVKMPFAEAAIDVDKPEDIALVEEILDRDDLTPARLQI